MIEYATRESQEAGFDEVARLIGDARTVVVCAHTSPDGDAIGSGLALADVIRRRWPGKRVCNMLADDATDVPRVYRFLPGADSFVHACDYGGNPDLFICCDLSSVPRLADARAVLARASHVAVLDHHPAREAFWEAGVVRPDAAAVGVLVWAFARRLGLALTPDEAQCLFCAVATDTGRFQYQNADPESFEAASAFVAAGARPSEVALRVYQSDRLSYMHLESRVLGRVRTFEDGRIAYSYATRADLEATGVDVSETDGLIDLVRCVDGAEVALLLKEVAGNRTRGNLRAKTDLDVSEVAALVGGGGHKAAAGFTCEGDLDETLSVVLPALRSLVRGESLPEAGDAR